MVQFIVLVAVFEYLFFKLVVNKYKILDQKTLLCNLASEMLKWNGASSEIELFSAVFNKCINKNNYLILFILLKNVY